MSELIACSGHAQHLLLSLSTLYPSPGPPLLPWRLFRGGSVTHCAVCACVALVARVVMTGRWGYSSPAKSLQAKQPLPPALLHSPSIYLSIKERIGMMQDKRKSSFASLQSSLCSFCLPLSCATLCSHEANCRCGVPYSSLFVAHAR